MGSWLFPTARTLPGGLVTPSGPLPQPSDNPVTPPDPGGCSYFNQVRYKSYRAVNGTAANPPFGNFTVESEKIRDGYWWKVLYADGRFQSTAPEQLAFFLAPESSRGAAMEQSSTAANAELPDGILLQGQVQPAATFGGQTTAGFLGVQLPVYPLTIPNGFFLRLAVLSIGNGAQQGVGMALRMAYLELALGDPGPCDL
jgi:hypothetical protein